MLTLGMYRIALSAGICVLQLCGRTYGGLTSCLDLLGRGSGMVKTLVVRKCLRRSPWGSTGHRRSGQLWLY
ncbi:uncharacterized protein LY89DRAFT_769435 [Mollisia scopiformis]|uniref:Secreted protein n=1 Tax=Mollisia scopiformis TaxID=149040 RepID=A0A132B2A7_MOLSC|nr:uncharacterized protein LY89DRAFT_769435 [Mollisia scopiformis]KUJ06520.1 hypothetical protein LY89DRAFT_769435 [Mollisia scopiformis]